VPLKSDSVYVSLDALRPGIDNIRLDVFLSPDFSRALRTVVRQVIAKHIRAEEELNPKSSSGLVNDIDRFQIACRELILNGISKAKQASEVQIDYLVQISVLKLLIAEVNSRYLKTVDFFKSRIRGCEVTSHHREAAILQKQMSVLVQYKGNIISAVGKELLQYFMQVQMENLDEMRRFTFGKTTIISDEMFNNPMLFMEKPSDDYFTLKEYEILLGHRMEDPERYDAVLSLIKNFFHEVRRSDLGSFTPERLPIPDFQENLDEWLKVNANIDPLFNCFQTTQQYRRQKKEGGGKEALRKLKATKKAQRLRLRLIYQLFMKAGILEKIIAAYEMQPVYLDYCPPLVPHFISQYLVSNQGKKNLVARVKQLRKFYGESLSIIPLREIRKKIRKLGRRKAEGYLIRFLKDFLRYHRDLHYLDLITGAMERVNLLTEKRAIELSRTNTTLYEFLLPHEQYSEGSAITGHVILKADVRGSTDITHQMMRKRQNPATHFSLNFFDPITEILGDYGAEKVFVEGDALILSIFEYENIPEGGYAVSRACGLALRILSIVKRYNEKNTIKGLPSIELGIGICYKKGQPAFLFDENKRIMISSAINIADRLAGCSRTLRLCMVDQRKMFNLYLFQTISNEDINATSDDLYLRYNVNGIQLNSSGFEKLRKENVLKKVYLHLEGNKEKKEKFYTCIFPLVNGNYDRLVIRQGGIPKVDFQSLKVISHTGNKYYEVCTNRRINDYIRKSFQDSMGGSSPVSPTGDVANKR